MWDICVAALSVSLQSCPLHMRRDVRCSKLKVFMVGELWTARLRDSATRLGPGFGSPGAELVFCLGFAGCFGDLDPPVAAS